MADDHDRFIRRQFVKVAFFKKMLDGDMQCILSGKRDHRCFTVYTYIQQCDRFVVSEQFHDIDSFDKEFGVCACLLGHVAVEGIE